MTDLNIAIGIVLKRVREERHLSQEKLAFEAEVDRTFISQLERGLKGVSVNTLNKITTALNIDLIEFLTIVKNEHAHLQSH